MSKYWKVKQAAPQGVLYLTDDDVDATTARSINERSEVKRLDLQ